MNIPLSIITRVSNRPNLFKRCQTILSYQDDKRFEHFIVKDYNQSGLLAANRLICEKSIETSGAYIYVLDDDDFLICDNFISGFRRVIRDQNFPDIIMVKGYIRHEIWPKNWPSRIPARREICSSNFIVKREFYHKHRRSWCAPRAGDFFFIRDVFYNHPDLHIYFWDKLVFYSDPSYGMSEEKKDAMGLIKKWNAKS